MKRGRKQEVGGEELIVERVIGCTANTAESVGVFHSHFIFPVGSCIKLTEETTSEYLFCRKGKTISCLDVSKDSKYIVTGEIGHDPYVCVWDATSKKAEAKVSGHKFGIQCVRFSPDGDTVVSLSEVHDQQVQLWNWRTKEILATSRTNSMLDSIWVGKGFFVGVGKGTIKRWAIKDKLRGKGKKLEVSDLRATKFEKAAFRCVVGRAKSDQIHVLTAKGILCVFSLSTLSLRKWVDLRMSVGTSLDIMGDKLLIGGGKGKIRIFDSESLVHLCTFPEPPLESNELGKKFPDLIAAKFNPETEQVLCIYNTRSLVSWQLSLSEEILVSLISVQHYHQKCIWDMSIIDDESCGADLVTCAEDCTVRFWNIAKECQVSIFQTEDPGSARSSSLSGNKSVVRSLCCNEQTIVLANRRGQVRQYFLPTLMRSKSNPQPQFQHSDHSKEVLSVDMYFDGERSRVVSSGRDRSIVLYDTEDFPKSKNIIKLAHPGTINSVLFASAGSCLMSCGADKSVMFHSISDSDFSVKPSGKGFVPRGCFHHACVHPGNKFAITAGSDKLLRVWNVLTGAQARQYTTGSAEPLKVCLDRSGMYIGVSCSDKSVRLLDWFSGQCLFKSFVHSDTVTALTFSSDCTRLISCDGNGCIVVWKLPVALVAVMRERLQEVEASQKAKKIECRVDIKLQREKSSAAIGSPKQAFQEKEDITEQLPEKIEFSSPAKREDAESIEEFGSKLSANLASVNNKPKYTKSKWAERIQSPYKLYTKQSEVSTTIRPQDQMKVMTITSMEDTIEHRDHEECCIDDLENEVDKLQLTSTSEFHNVEEDGGVPVSFVQSLAEKNPDPFGDLQDGHKAEHVDLQSGTPTTVEKETESEKAENSLEAESVITNEMKTEQCQESEKKADHPEEVDASKHEYQESENENNETTVDKVAMKADAVVGDVGVSETDETSGWEDLGSNSQSVTEEASTTEESYDELLSELMQILDENHDSSLSIAELCKAFPKMKESFIQVVHRYFDRDKSSGLDLHELRQFFADEKSLREAVENLRNTFQEEKSGINEVSREEMLRDLMQLLDANRDGSLSVKELANSFPNMSKDSVEVVHKCFDQDHSSELDMEELSHFFSDDDSLKDALETLRASLTPYQKALRRLLKLLDTDGDDLISQQELSKLYPNMGEKSLQALCQLFDEDGNGKLDHDELAKFVPDLSSAESMLMDLLPPKENVDAKEIVSPVPDNNSATSDSVAVDEFFDPQEITVDVADRFLDVSHCTDAKGASIPVEISPANVTEASDLDKSEVLGTTITSMRTTIELLRHQWTEGTSDARSEMRKELVEIRNEITKILCEPCPSDTLKSHATDLSTNSEVVSTIENYSDLLVQMVHQKLQSLNTHLPPN